MPHLVYLTTDDSFRSRLLLHAERVLPAWWGTLGLLLTLSIAFGGRKFEGSLEPFHWLVTLGVAGALFVSGAALFVVQIRRSDSVAWRYERLGWTIGAGAWLVYGMAILRYGDSSYVTLSLPVAMIALCIVRLRALEKTESRIRKLAGA